MVSAKVTGGNEYYFFDDSNKRIAKMSSSGGMTVYIYGASGEKPSVATSSSTLFGQITNNVYFAGRLIKQNTDTCYGAASNRDDNFVAIYRTGSMVRAYADSSDATYLPHGEEITGIANDQIKFGTYTRDSSTLLDYADQRFYTSQFGRFMSADRFKQAAKANDSGSWNKYNYTRGDPVNSIDPSGMDDCPADFCATGTGYGDDPYGGFGEDRGQKGNSKNQGNDPPTTAIMRASQASQELKAALSMWTNCVTALGGSSVVSSFTKQLTFLDGRGPGNLNRVGDPNNNYTFTSYASSTGAFAATLLDSTKTPSQTIVLFANFFGDDSIGQEATLIHELFHSETKISDHYTLDVSLQVKNFGIGVAGLILAKIIYFDYQDATMRTAALNQFNSQTQNCDKLYPISPNSPFYGLYGNN